MNIDLRDFISQTLIDICYGVSNAQKHMIKTINNQPIAPVNFNGHCVDSLEQKVSFDICVTASNDKKISKEGGISIRVLSGEAKGEQSEYHSQTNRIQFTIPFYPQAVSPSTKQTPK